MSTPILESNETNHRCATKQGDGRPWTPALAVKCDNSGFYRIKVGK